VLHSLRVRRHTPFAALTVYDLVDSLPIYEEALGDSFIQHPSQSDLGEAAIFLWIATTNVTMNSGKPDLLAILPFYGAKKIGPKVSAHLID
jgi:hypothetical protein